MSYNPQNPNGQAAMANSEPVVIASDQTAVPISGTVTTTPSGTQTVSGTVTANAGTNLNTSLLALESGGNLATIAANTGNIPASPATTAKQDTGNASLASIDGKITAVNTGAVVVSSSALPTGAATSTKQSDGSQKTQVVDGSGNVIGATSNALDVNIKSGGTTSTEYAEGATAATATGTLAMGKSGTTLKAAQTDSSGNLRVDLSQTSANATAIKVDGSATTQPVSGTVAATQSGTWTVQPGNTANTTAWKVDGSAVTQPVSLASVPSHAVTNAGTFAVQAAGDVAAAATDSGNPVKVGAKYNSTKPTYTDGQRGDLQIGSRGSLGVQVMNVDGTAGAGVATPADTVSGAGSLSTQSQGMVYNGSTWDRMRSGGVTGMAGVSGDTASGSSDAGNPVKVGGKYNSTKPTFTDGQRGDLQIGTRGSLSTQLMAADSASPISSPTLADGLTNATTPHSVAPFNLVFNGTTWDRVRSGGVTGFPGISGDTASGSSDAGNPVKVGAKYNSTLPTFTDGQRGDLQIGTRGALNVSLFAPSGTSGASVGTAADGASASNALHSIGYPVLYNGSTYDRTRSGGVTGMAGVSGDTANAATDAGNPLKIGGVGKTTNPTAVTDGQRVNATFDKLGKQVVVGSIRDLKGVQQTTITSSTAETTIVTQVASTFLDLYGLILTNTSATVTKVTIKDSTAGTTRAVIEVPATETRGFMLPESGGIPQATVNNNWTATCGTSVASVEITALYVKNT